MARKNRKRMAFTSLSAHKKLIFSDFLICKLLKLRKIFFHNTCSKHTSLAYESLRYVFSQKYPLNFSVFLRISSSILSSKTLNSSSNFLMLALAVRHFR